MSYRRFHLSEVFGAPYVGTRRLNQKPWFADDQPQLRPETTRKVSQRRIPKMTKLQTRRSTHKTDPHENGEFYLGIGHQNGDSCPPSAFEWAPTPKIPSHLALGIPHATAEAPNFLFFLRDRAVSDHGTRHRPTQRRPLGTKGGALTGRLPKKEPRATGGVSTQLPQPLNSSQPPPSPLNSPNSFPPNTPRV